MLVGWRISHCALRRAFGRELRALRRLHREGDGRSPFVSERGSPMTTSNIAKLIEKACEVAKIELSPPMMLATCEVGDHRSAYLLCPMLIFKASAF